VHVATYHGHVETTRALCELGADSNTPDDNGSTPLSVVALQGHIEAIRALCELGADVNILALLLLLLRLVKVTRSL
jgi:uncharacterized protein